MTAAAIAAQLVDMRNVGTHKVLKLTIHIPEEQALAAIAAFGWPTGVDPVPIAIARLNYPGEALAATSPNVGGNHEHVTPAQSTEPKPRQETGKPSDGAKAPKCQPPHGQNCTEPFNWDDNVPYCDTCGMFRSNEAHRRIPKVAPKTDFRDMRLAKQAGRLCNEVPFQKFIAEQLKCPHPFTPEQSADYVRRRCNVASRKDIRPRTPSGDRWRALFNDYQVWMHALEPA